MMIIQRFLRSIKHVLHKNPQSADNLNRHNISIKIVLKVPRVLLASIRNKEQRILTNPYQVPRDLI